MIRFIYLVVLICVTTKLHAQRNFDSIAISIPFSIASIDTTWYESSKRIHSLDYKASNPNRKLFIYYDDSTSRLKSVIPYLGLWMHGASISWYANGAVQSKVAYWKGCLISGYYFFPSGKKQIEIVGDTTLNIVWTYYYESGAVERVEKSSKCHTYSWVGYCENGQKQFEDYAHKKYQFTSYHCNGKRFISGTKDENMSFIGLYRKWYENGQLAEKGEYIYIKGKSVPVKDGKWVYYNEDGTMKKKEVFKKGKLVKSSGT